MKYYRQRFYKQKPSNYKKHKFQNKAIFKLFCRYVYKHGTHDKRPYFCHNSLGEVFFRVDKLLTWLWHNLVTEGTAVVHAGVIRFNRWEVVGKAGQIKLERFICGVVCTSVSIKYVYIIIFLQLNWRIKTSFSHIQLSL